jgi:hypothetical protein
MSFEFDNHVEGEWHRTILREKQKRKEDKKAEREGGNSVATRKSRDSVQAKPLHTAATLPSLFQNTPLHPFTPPFPASSSPGVIDPGALSALK